MGKDALDEIVDQLRAAVPDFPEDKLNAAARKIREDLGGGMHYFRKAPSVGKAFRLGEQIAAGVPLVQAFENVGVCRAWGYRLIGRRARRAA